MAMSPLLPEASPAQARMQPYVEEMDFALGVAGEEGSVCDHADERARSIR
jgi:hypothetical protein